MAEPGGRQRLILSPAARQDLREVLRWSLDRFGDGASARYRALLTRALRDIEADPLRPGSRIRPELYDGARTYHLALSRSRVDGARVGRPRHFVLYRVGLGGIEVARILHDSRDLARHVPEEWVAP